jgi:hypothetical protein
MLVTSGESGLHLGEGVAQAFARAVQADPHGRSVRAERDCELLSR